MDYSHPDLTSNIIKGYDFVNGDADPMDDFGHGTHVAGIIAAKMNNGLGMAGVSTGKVVAVKVLGSQGWGTNFDVAAGINYCANRTDVKVLSMSLGGSDDSDAVYTAVGYAVNTKGKLLVAAAGNASSSTANLPGRVFDRFSEQGPGSGCLRPVVGGILIVIGIWIIIASLITPIMVPGSRWLDRARISTPPRRGISPST